MNACYNFSKKTNTYESNVTSRHFPLYKIHKHYKTSKRTFSNNLQLNKI